MNAGHITGQRLTVIKPPASKRPSRRDIIRHTAQQAASIAADLDSWREGTGLAVWLGRSCGLTIAECPALRVEDFRSDSEGRMILRVSRQVQYGETCALRSKTADDFRLVPVSDAVAVMVRDRKQDLGPLFDVSAPALSERFRIAACNAGCRKDSRSTNSAITSLRRR